MEAKSSRILDTFSFITPFKVTILWLSACQSGNLFVVVLHEKESGLAVVVEEKEDLCSAKYQIYCTTDKSRCTE